MNKRIIKTSSLFLIMGVLALSTVGCDNEPETNVTGDTSNQTEENQTPEAENNGESKEKQENTEQKEKVPTEYKSALTKAKMYSDTMSMSKASIYDQLTSEHGEKFSAEAGQYAIDNFEADWKENALKKAKTYQDDMAMSPDAIYEQLISEHGEKFTEEEAQYAVDNLE